MSSLIEYVQALLADVRKDVDLEICTEMYEALAEECAPQTPSEFFGIQIKIDPKLDDPDYVVGQKLQ